MMISNCWQKDTLNNAKLDSSNKMKYVTVLSKHHLKPHRMIISLFHSENIGTRPASLIVEYTNVNYLHDFAEKLHLLATKLTKKDADQFGLNLLSK